MNFQETNTIAVVAFNAMCLALATAFVRLIRGSNVAWSWSHTGEAYDNAYKNLQDMDKSNLEIIYAEWHAATDSKGNIDSEAWFKSKYAKALRQAKKLSANVLADFIWEKASEWATCDNGGYNAWMCPSGCGCHTVSFDREECNEHCESTD